MTGQFHAVAAIKRKVPAKVALLGPSGSGKTYTALNIARGLAGPDGRIVVFDSEHGTATRYARLVEFDHVNLPDYEPSTYASAVQWASDQGYDVCVLDSLSHAWTQGALKMVDEYATKHRGDSFGAWRLVTPEHNAMVDALVGSRIHLVATIRVKTEYVREDITDGKGNKKAVVRKIGLAPVQRDGLEYEFDLVADIDSEHALLVTKSRFPDFTDRRVKKPGVTLGEELARAVDGAPAVEDELRNELRVLLGERYDDDAFDELTRERGEEWLRRAITKAAQKPTEVA